jgi:hypothetical protein
MLDNETRWSHVIAAATRPPASIAERHAALQVALGAGASITVDSVGCSITETTPHGFHTPAASDDLALILDLAQYEADDGPCVAACRDGRVHSIVVMGDEDNYAGFTAAAVARGVRSSLSLPLLGTQRRSALNLYASSTSAFEASHARNVAGFLARCVTALLPTFTAENASVPELATAEAAHVLAAQARQVLQNRHGIDAATAFQRLTHLSRTQRRGIGAIAHDILDGKRETHG